MTAPFDLHLLRHGALETPGLLLGRTDAAPTAGGIAACRARVAGLGVEAVISSDLARCRLVAAAIDAAPTFDPRWRELDFGAWDGLATEAIDPQAFARFHDDPDAAPPPGGERWSALVARVGSAIGDLPPHPTLVVTHGGAMRGALAVLCGFDHRQGWALHLPYAALLSLRVWPRAAQIVGLRA